MSELCQWRQAEITRVPLPESVDFPLLVVCIGKRKKNIEIADELGMWRRNLHKYIIGEAVNPRYLLGVSMIGMLQDTSPEDMKKCVGQEMLPSFPTEVDWHGLDCQLRRAMRGTDAWERRECEIRRGNSPGFRKGAMLLNQAYEWLPQIQRERFIGEN